MTVKLGPGEKVIFEGHPSWRSILGYYVNGFAATIVLVAVLYFWDKLIGSVSTGLFVVVLAAGAAITVIAGVVRRIATRYTITNRRLQVKHGIVSRDVQETRLERVQDVNYRQTVWERVVQIGDVDFDTASNDPSDFIFAGVAQPEKIVEQVHAATAGSSGLGDGGAGPPAS